MQQLPLSFTHKMAPRGYTASSTTIARYMFSTESGSTISTTLSYSASTVGYFYSNAKGYMAGGPGNVTTANSFTFSSEVRSIITSLSTGNQGSHGSSNRTTHGYLQNGPASGSGTAIIKLTFSTDTWSSIGNATYGPAYGGAGASSSTVGYGIGGYTGGTSYSSGVTKVTFSSDSIASSTALPTGVGNMSACQSSTKAYVLEGAKNGDLFANVIQTITFSDDSTATLGSAFSHHFLGSAPMNSSTRGYSVGGAYSDASPNTTVQYIVFSGETVGQAGNFVIGIGDGNIRPGWSVNA